MRVNWLTYTDERDFDRVESTIWIRCYQLVPYLEERGVRCTINEPDREADVSVILRWQDEAAQAAAREQKRKGRIVVWDICTNTFDAGVFKGGYGITARHVEEARAMARLVDAVTCVSGNIAARVNAWHPWVEVLPESVDGRHFVNRKNHRDFERRRLRAIWCGTTVKAWEVLPIWTALARHRYKLTIISERNPFPRWSMEWLKLKACVGYRHIPWHYDTLPTSLVQGDVCVSPRNVSAVYNQGHSHFKIALFLAEGVPVLASPVPSYEALLRDGKAGRICGDPQQWADALRACRTQRDLLTQWSAAACEVVAPYSTARVADMYVDFFRRIVAGRNQTAGRADGRGGENPRAT